MKLTIVGNEATRTRTKVVEGYAIMHVKTSQWVHTYTPPDMDNDGDAFVLLCAGKGPVLFNTKKEAFAVRKKVASSMLHEMHSLEKTGIKEPWAAKEAEKMKDFIKISDYKVGKYVKIETTKIEFKC